MRSLWIGTLAAALSCTAPGWSQVLQPDRWIMVREEGKPAVKCRVVSSTKQKDGCTLCKARTESGETITLLEETVQGGSGATTRMRVLPATSEPMLDESQPRLPQLPTVNPTPPLPTPVLTPVPKPTLLPAVVQAKPEEKKESPTLLGRLLGSGESQPTVVTNPTPAPKPTVMPPVAQTTPEEKKDSPTLLGRFFGSASSKPEAKKTEPVVKQVAMPGSSPNLGDSRPQLPVSTTSTDDPLSRPDLYTKGPGSAIALPPMPTTETPKQTNLIGRVFNRTETPIVTTQATTKVETPPAPAPQAAPAGQPRVGLLNWLQSSAPPATPKATVASEPKEVTPSVLDKMRAQQAARLAAATPAESRTGLPTGMGSVVAVNDRAIMARSPGGAMVRTVTGGMAYLPPDTYQQGPNSVPVSAANAFTLSMPGGGPAMMQPGMPQMAMQSPAVSDTGVPEGAANAFTRGGTTRPIPADFGGTPQNPNAFLVEGMGGAYSRPMAMGYDPRMGYAPPAGYYYPQMPAMPMARPAGQMLAVLRRSVMPSEREQAVALLSQCNWHAEPEAVAAITTAAKSDPAPAVRVCCIKALARMQVNTMPVYEALVELKADKDVRVRQEAEQTLATMTRH